jgi:hypothetical protein
MDDVRASTTASSTFGTVFCADIGRSESDSDLICQLYPIGQGFGASQLQRTPRLRRSSTDARNIGTMVFYRCLIQCALVHKLSEAVIY